MTPRPTACARARCANPGSSEPAIERHPHLLMFKLNRPLAALLITASLSTTFSFGKDDPQPNSAVATNLAVLANADAPFKAKVDACRELARLGGREAVAPLAALLPDEKLSHAARYGLETIPDPAVDDCFRKALGELHGRPLVGVIGSVGVRHDPGAVNALIRFLSDGDPEVAQAAARSLGSIATPAAIQALEAALATAPTTNQLALCEGLLRGAEHFTAQGETRGALAVYDRLRTQSVPHQVRTAAWRGTILTGGSSGMTLLREALASPDYALFAIGVRVSDEITNQVATAALAEQLPKTTGDRALLLLEALGRRGDPAALPAIAEAATKTDKPIRLAALRALSQCGSPQAVPVLGTLVFDPNHEIAKAAGESLAALPGEEASRAILAMLTAPERERRLTAMDLAARRRLASALPELNKAARESDPAIRRQAVKTLGSLAGPGDLPVLLELLAQATDREDLDGIEQAVSAVCLRAGAPAACVQQIADSLARSKPAQKCALLRILNALGGPVALQSVRKAVSDPEPEVHSAAIHALAAWNSREAAPDLIALARTVDQPAERLLCLRGYLGFASQGETPEPQRLAMCREAAGLALKPEEKKLLLAALGGIPSLDALALVQGCLDDSALQKEAASAVLDIAAKLLEGPDAGPTASKLIEPLEKVAQANASADLTARAKKLAEQARAKAGGK